MPVLCLIVVSEVRIRGSVMLQTKPDRCRHGDPSPTRLVLKTNLLMLKTLTAIPLLSVVFGCLFTACLSDNQTEIVVSNDCVVTQIKLGKLHREIKTRTADGKKDSVYVQNVPGRLYELTIDQHNNTIYNADSLPFNTNVKRVVLSALSVRGGATLQSLATGRDTIVSLTDSIDFSQPRRLTIHGEDGISKRTYTIELRVHREEGDSAKWSRRSAADWDARHFADVQAGKFAASTLKFKIENGKIYRSANGLDWQEDACDAADTPFLPTTGVVGVGLPMRKDGKLEEVVMYGTQNGESRIWKRHVDLSGTYDFSWTYYPVTAENPLGAPALNMPCLLPFDDGLLLIGVDAGQRLVMRFSRDRGRTWKHHDTFRLPFEAAEVSALKATVDEHNNVWLRIGQDTVWSGTINRLQWKKVKHIFF